MALAVDLVPEYDGDDSYRTALLAAAAKTDKPLAVLTSIPAAIDTDAAVRLRGSGIPVLESTCTGLQALRHLLAHPATSPGQPHPSGSEPAGTAQPAISSAPANTAAASVRRSRWSAALAARPLPAADLFAMLRDYGIPAVRAASAATVDQALAAAAAIGYPVALKTDMPGISHKSDVGGVRLGIMDPAELADAYADVSPALAPGSPSPKWPPQARNSSWAWPVTRPWAR